MPKDPSTSAQIPDKDDSRSVLCAQSGPEAQQHMVEVQLDLSRISENLIPRFLDDGRKRKLSK